MTRQFEGPQWLVLSELCDIIQGQSPPGDTYNQSGDGLPFFQGKAEFGEISPVVVKWTTAAKKTAQAGDVLLSIRAPVGPTNVADRTCAIGRGLAALRPKAGVPTGYLRLALEATVRELTAKATGSTFEAVSGAAVRAHKIPWAGHDVAEVVVAHLDLQLSRLDAAVAALKRAQANLKRYRASVLQAAVTGRLVPTEHDVAQAEGRDYETGEQLQERISTSRKGQKLGTRSAEEPTPRANLPDGWGWAPCGSIVEKITSGSRGWAQYYSTDGDVFLRMTNLEHEDIRLDLADIQRVTPPAGAEGERTLVRPGDILISITADIGMVGLVPIGMEKAYINQHVALVRPALSETSTYLAHYLSASEGGRYWMRKLQRGATKVGLGLDDIRAVPVPLPPLAEQARIVEEVERRLSVADRLEATLEANLRRATRLRQAILKKAFTFE